MIIEPDGSHTLELRDITPASLRDEMLLERVPVYTRLTDGTLNQGQYWTNTNAGRATPSASVAGAITIDNEGTWSVEDFRWSWSHGTVPPGTTVEVGSLDFLAIDYIPDAATQLAYTPLQGPRRVPVIFPVIDQNGRPSDLSAAEVTASINKAIEVWEALLSDFNFGPITIEFSFTQTNALAFAEVLEDDRRWNTIFNQVVLLYDTNVDGDGTEQSVYNWLPTGSTIPFQWEGDSTDSEDDIDMALPLIRSVFGNSVPVLRVRISDQAGLFDTDPTDGVSGGLIDLTAVLVHEIGHHMGFISRVGRISFPESITMLDVFRFPESRGPSISASTMLGGRRELFENAPALSGLSINSVGGVYEMSRGGPIPDLDENQAGHWEDIDPSTGDRIGIMGPVFYLSTPGTTLGSYLTPADIEAFDTIGYVINQDTLWQPVTEAILQFPAVAASVDPTVDLTFTWQIAPEATSYHAYVDRVLVGGDRERVFSAPSLAAGTSSVVVPANTMFAGRDYEWFVTTENVGGYAYTTPIAFDTGDCIADTNNDGQVTPADFNAWIIAFNTQSPACDQNADGACTPADFNAWIINFNNGC